MDLTYDLILKEVQNFSEKYLKGHKLPILPSNTELEKYQELLDSDYPELLHKVKKHLKLKGTSIGHGYEHLLYVSKTACFIAESECAKMIDQELKKKIIKTTMLSGLLHDIDRDLGFGEIHMIEGEKTATKLLNGLGIRSETVAVIVRNHDHFEFNPGKNSELNIAYGSVFDADHFQWGLERKNTFWENARDKKKPMEKVIHDYEFLYPLKNAWKTEFGKKTGPKLIEFGLAVAKHVEQKFSN